ncbi:hypothetical protein GW626_09070 [Peribacillus muralis]|nr:hypothetical protein [Peribacillus muralis]MCK1993784.1 hypothetical protein [Peribacillus muralis]MCK2013927.1 hypothetical protein [Peribacillus muralis]
MIEKVGKPEAVAEDAKEKHGMGVNWTGQGPNMAEHRGLVEQATISHH